MEITNLLAFGMRTRAINAPFTGGSLAFSTIANAGTMTATGARSVSCSPGLLVRATIVWDLAADAQRPAISGQCPLTNSIVGPAASPGATNTDPQFVDLANNDFHLQPNSPARDAVDIGPPTDFEGDERPRGSRFDTGADETP